MTEQEERDAFAEIRRLMAQCREERAAGREPPKELLDRATELKRRVHLAKTTGKSLAVEATADE